MGQFLSLVSWLRRHWMIATAAGFGIGVLVVAALTLSTGNGDDQVSDRVPNLEFLLSLVPDTSETRVAISLYDFERLRKVLGVELPSNPSDSAAAEKYTDALMIGRDSYGPLFMSGLNAAGRVVISPKTIGYGAAHVDAEINAGVPPRRFDAIVGRFDPAATKAAIMDCRDCLQPEVKSFKGAEYYSWGDGQDLRGRLQPPVFDELGRGGRWFFSRHFVLRAFSAEGIEAMIDASKDRGALLNDADYKGLIRGLAATKPYFAYITSETPGPEYATYIADLYQKSGLPVAAPSGVLRSYSLIGSGRGEDEKGLFLSIVLAHGSDKAARESVAVIKGRVAADVSLDGRKWSAIITNLEVYPEGRFLIAKFYGDLTFLEPSPLFPLLLHE